jgi:hypothetical protein
MDWPGPDVVDENLDMAAVGSVVNKRRFQFRVASLLALVAVVAVLCAVPVHQRYLASEQKAIAAFITQEGGFFNYNEFTAQPRYPMWLKARIGRDYVVTLDAVVFVQHKNTDAVLSTLAKLPGLHLLKLPACDVTQNGLASLAGVKRLKWLELAATPTTDEGLRRVATIRSIEILDLRNTDVTDEGIVTLKSMPRLKELLVGGSKMTRMGIEQLRTALPSCKIDTMTTF